MIRFAIVAAALSFAAPALADSPRFQLQTVEGGVVRLDTVTGAMDFCTVAASGLKCETALAAPKAASADAAPLDPKQLEQQMDQASKAMSVMLPVMLKSMKQMSATMEREMEKQAR